MSNAKRITDLTDYTSILPYASELFGVYQPLIGWKSKRRLDRIKFGVGLEKNTLLSRLRQFFESKATITFNQDCAVTSPDLGPAGFAGPPLIPQDAIVLKKISEKLRQAGKVPASADEWRHFVNDDVLIGILRADVLKQYDQVSVENCRQVAALAPQHETAEAFRLRQEALRQASQLSVNSSIENEAILAGILKVLAESDRTAELQQVFYAKQTMDSKQAFF
jgi:hypothetical protein